MLFLFLFVSTFLKGQHINRDVVVLSQPLPETSILGYNDKDEEIFKLDSTERPSLKVFFYDVFTALDSWARYAVYDFKEGYLPVQGKHGWYWINRDGRIVKKFGNLFLEILQPSQKIYAAIRFNNKENKKELVYIDSIGRVLFDDLSFLNLNNFKNNIAVLRKSTDKKWYLANAKTKNLKLLDSYLQKRILYVFSYVNGLCKVHLKNGKVVFLNESGEIHLHQKNLNGGNSLFQYELFGKYIVGKSDEYIIQFDFDGNQIKKFPFYFEFIQITDKYILTTDGSLKATLFSHQYDVISLPVKENEIFVVDYLSDSLIGGVLLDTINHSMYYRLLSTIDFSEKMRTPEREMVLYYYHSPKYFYDVKIARSYNMRRFWPIYRKQKYFSDSDIKIYSFIPPVKYKVSFPARFQIHGAEPLKYLKYFPNTSYLQIYQYKEKHFPKAMEKLKDLTEIYLKDCQALSYIPFSWMSLPNLTKATFYGCPNIQGLNTFIERNVNLTHFETDTHYFDPAFYDDMKKSRPNLKIYINGVLR